MSRKYILAILLATLQLWCFGQDPDSLTIVHTQWQKNKIAKQLTLFRHHFNAKNLFAANQNISFLEIKNTGRKVVFELAGEPKDLVTVSDFGIRDTALAAINGNFFDVKNGGSVDFLRINGKTINENRLDKNNKRARHQQTALVIERGKIAVKTWDGSPDWESRLPQQNVMLNGPLLLLNNVAASLDTASFNRLRHPRTCLGIKPNGSVVLLVVDGRNDNSAGMSLFELTKVMRWLGCTNVVNFDGGGSSTLWVNGFPDNGVVNYPTDNKKWDHAGERKVANVILLKKK